MAIIQREDKQAASDLPLYRRIQNNLRERVERGDWQSGQMLPSRRYLCAEFKTTAVTMDKAIQGLISEGVLRASRGSGTFVAEASVTPHALRIGVVIKRDRVRETLEENWNDNFYFGPLFGGIRDGVVGQPVEVIYSHIERADYRRYFHDTSLDGMILVLPPLDDIPVLEELARAGIPFVATGFSTGTAENGGLPCVDVSNRQGAMDAVNHLIGLGHERIAIVNMAISQANHHDRLEGYRRAIAAAGLPLSADDLLIHPTYNATHFEPLIEEWITCAADSGSLPTAIFACDYLMTLATLRVLRRHGIRVPDDISVVGFDDPVSAADLTPALTTVSQPVGQIGRLAARRLLGALTAGGDTLALKGAEILPTKLIVRESTAPPRATQSLNLSQRHVGAVSTKG